jgi:hypothetical protein
MKAKPQTDSTAHEILKPLIICGLLWIGILFPSKPNAGLVLRAYAPHQRLIPSQYNQT